MKWVIADLSQILFVKEQRVNGSSVLYKKAVRCTLVAGKPVMKINSILSSNYVSIREANSFNNKNEIFY